MDKRHFFAGLATAANRALLFADGSYAVSDGGGGFVIPRLGLSWRLRLRLRLDGTSHGYVWRVPTGLLDAFCLYQRADGTFGLFSADNYAGADPALYLSPAVTDTAYHVLDFVYANDVLTAHLDGAVAGTVTLPGFEPKGGVLVFAERSGEVRWHGAVDAFQLWIGTTLTVDLQMNEVAGPPQNTGSLGGELSYYAPSGGPPFPAVRETL